MSTKNLMSSIKHVNRFIIEDLSAQLVELSEEDLQQISGGCDCIVITYPNGTKIEIPVPRQSNSLSSQHKLLSLQADDRWSETPSAQAWLP